MKSSITIWGSCITDNTFYYAAINGHNDYLIKNRFFQLSPISLVNGDAVNPLMDWQPKDNRQVVVSSIRTDIENNFFEKLKKKKTDYIIIDLVSCRFDVMQIDYEDSVSYMSLNEGNRKNEILAELSKQTEFQYSYEILQPGKMSDYYDRLKIFCRKLLEIYSEEQIIIIDYQPASAIFLDDPEMDVIGLNGKDEIIKSSFEFMCKCFPKAHIIRPLDIHIADIGHFQGKGRSHYIREVYDYYYESINIITDKNDAETEQKLLSELQNKYSLLSYKLFSDRTALLISQYNEIRSQFGNEIEKEKALRRIDGDFLDNIRSEYFPENKAEPYFDKYDDLNKLFEHYIDSGKEYIVIMSVCETAENVWEKFKFSSCFGLKDKLMKNRGYIAAVDIKNHKSEEICSCDGNSIEYKFQLKSASGKEHSVYISSKGKEINQKKYNTGGWSRIVIDNINYSPNMKGINCIVYDKQQDRVEDIYYIAAESNTSFVRRRIFTQPKNFICKTGENAVFTIYTTNKDLKFRWQFSFDKENWFNQKNGIGIDKNQLIIPNVQRSWSGVNYRCRISEGDVAAYTENAVLTVR